MATKRKARRRKNRNFVAIPFQTQLSLGTLGDQTVVRFSLLNGNLLEDLYIMSIDATLILREHTAGEGPLYTGFAHSDYSVAEIDEAIDVDGFLGPQLKIEQERARRLVRRWGTFRGLETDEIIARSDGGHRRYKVRWVQEDGANVQGWIQNSSGGALTTGTVLEVDGYIYGRWLL